MDTHMILEKKLEAAKNDLEEWRSFSDTRGQAKPEVYAPSFSCQFMGINDGIACCQSRKYGNCVFIGCRYKPCHQEWGKHHTQFHPDDDALYVACNECSNIRNKVVSFMEGAISDLERELKNLNILNERMRSIAKTTKEQKKRDGK